MAIPIDDGNPPGVAAPEILEGRIWVDGCWDFFHHGSIPHPIIKFNSLLFLKQDV